MVRVLVEETFRGRTMSEPVHLDNISYKTDHRLIPKDEEAEYCKWEDDAKPPKILPRVMDFPPLLKQLIMRETKGEINNDPKMEIVYHPKVRTSKLYRIAQEGEVPDVTFDCGLGTPVSPSLYENIKTEK